MGFISFPCISCNYQSKIQPLDKQIKNSQKKYTKNKLISFRYINFYK